jgi:hypothetical protein
MPARQQKITFAEMRAAGVRGLLIYCSDFRCSHWSAISGDKRVRGGPGRPHLHRADQWPLPQGWRHESGTYVKFTDAGAELFA